MSRSAKFNEGIGTTPVRIGSPAGRYRRRSWQRFPAPAQPLAPAMPHLGPPPDGRRSRQRLKIRTPILYLRKGSVKNNNFNLAPLGGRPPGRLRQAVGDVIAPQGFRQKLGWINDMDRCHSRASCANRFAFAMRFERCGTGAA